MRKINSSLVSLSTIRGLDGSDEGGSVWVRKEIKDLCDINTAAAAVFVQPTQTQIPTQPTKKYLSKFLFIIHSWLLVSKFPTQFHSVPYHWVVSKIFPPFPFSFPFSISPVFT